MHIPYSKTGKQKSRKSLRCFILHVVLIQSRFFFRSPTVFRILDNTRSAVLEVPRSTWSKATSASLVAMNTSAETEKGSILEVPNGAPLRRLATGSTLSVALDAEANITPEDLQRPQDSEKFQDPGPPPNGGLKAWLQVLGSFMLFFNSWVSLPAIEKRDSLPKAALSLVLILPRETLAEGAARPPSAHHKH
jgi:hypothetical protein